MARGYRPALPPSGKRVLMRQVAIGAVVAFALTVIALSVWRPTTGSVTPAPAPQQTPVPAPVATPVPTARMAPARGDLQKVDVAQFRMRPNVKMIRPMLPPVADAGVQ